VVCWVVYIWLCVGLCTSGCDCKFKREGLTSLPCACYCAPERFAEMMLSEAGSYEQFITNQSC
jgi:hypothetical protein